MTVTLGIGTLKGAWIARSDDRSTWSITGPHLRGWEVTALGRAPGGDYLLATGSNWYGAAIHRSSDLDEWTQVVDGPAYDGDTDRKLERIWTFAHSEGRIYAGVAEAGLFYSDDDATTWHPVEALNEHATRPGWHPGLGGLALHRVLVDPADQQRMWAAISAVGVFATGDAGATWELRNAGVTATVPHDEDDIGYCVHCIVADHADADRIWRQDHRGVYRTSDGGVTWERIQNGVPGSGFGFPVVRDPRTGRLLIIPLESDEYRMPVGGGFSVYKSDDDGDSWTAARDGLPDEPSYTGVLRGAMDIDELDATGVYFGTTSGEVWASSDTGESWSRLPAAFPRVTAVKVLDSDE